MYTKEESAIRFVIIAFNNQKRLKEHINASFHSISVGFMLKNIGCDEDTIITGLLHDIIEDTNYDYNYLKANYGQKIANNVLQLSEDKSIKKMIDRKTKFINNLDNVDDNLIIIEIADKLHNLISDYDLWKIKGNKALQTKKTTYEENKWYYLKLKALFNKRINNNKLLDRYNQITKLYFEEN